jgi:hypothetical protein
MSSVMTTNWQKRRGELNHDWLKNQYLIALGSWLNLLDKRITDPVLERSFVSEILPQWENARVQAESLARDFESEMSPCTLLNTPPLSRLDDLTKDWLARIIHRLWLRRCRADEMASTALLEVGRADRAYGHLKQALRRCSDTASVDAMRSLRSEFSEFRSCCQGVARAFEEFPSEVKAA